MKTNFQRLSWHPTIVKDINWTIDHLSEYLNGQPFVIYSNGTCVVWPKTQIPNNIDSTNSILSVVAHSPDFKVRKHSDGNFLVTFKGAVGGVMSGELLRTNFSILREEALSLGKLPSERFLTQDDESPSEFELIAGLYVRARLYLDAEELVIVDR